MLIWTKNNTKTDGEVQKTGDVFVTDCYPAVVRHAVPTAAAKNTISAANRALWIAIWAYTVE